MYNHKDHDQVRRLIGKCIPLQHNWCSNQDHSVPENRGCKCNPQKFTHIVVRRFRITGAHALPDHSHKGKPERGSHQGSYRPEALRHAVRRDLYCPEQSGNTAQCYFCKLEQSVLNPVWNRNSENPFHHARIPAKDILPLQINGFSLLILLPLLFPPPETQDQNHHCGKTPGNQRRVCNSCHACMKHEYTDCISRDIDPVRCQRYIHSHSGLPHAAVHSRACVVNCNRRKRIGGNLKIGHTRLHHVRIHLTEQKP